MATKYFQLSSMQIENPKSDNNQVQQVLNLPLLMLFRAA